MQGTQDATEQELQLLPQMRQQLSDFRVDKQYLEAKNLLRFLRARNNSLENALIMFKKHIEWREKQKIDTILQWQFPLQEYKSYWPCYVTGFDLMGNPVIVVPLGRWNPSKVSVVSYDTYVRYNVYNLEWVWQLLLQLSRGCKYMKQSTFIFDLQGLGWKNITTIDSVQAGNEILKLSEANYPEVLNLGFIVNAPYIFNIGYRIIKPFLSEYTQSKLRILPGSDLTLWKEEICKFISTDQFPRKYGGNLSDSVELDIVDAPWMTSSKSTCGTENIATQLNISYKNL